jgi:hypothetical protein
MPRRRDRSITRFACAGRPWQSLPRAAMGFRVAHIVWAILQLAALTTVWRSALLRRRGPATWPSAAFLLIQGAALVAGRGNCPFGPFQRRLGDPVPMFELVLPPRAAKAAIPALAVVAATGILGLILRPPAGTRGPGAARRRCR